MSKMPLQTKVIISEKEELFFKEVEFDFDALPPEIGQLAQTPNIASRLFLIQHVDESVEVKAYPTKDRAIMFNAWITKNITYKVAKQSIKQEIDPCPCPTPTPLATPSPFPTPPPATTVIGVGMKDAAGYPTVYGPLYHMTKVIDFGGFIEMELPPGETLNETDVVEVLSAEIVGSHDELLDPEPIYNSYTEMETQVIYVDMPLPFNPLVDPFPKFIKVPMTQQVPVTKYKEFDPKQTQYARLREKMCIKIKVKVVRIKHLQVDAEE